MSTVYTVYANEQELKQLDEEDDFLFHNYSWKHHPGFLHVMEVSFPEAEMEEAMALYHELWKLHLPSLSRNWS